MPTWTTMDDLSDGDLVTEADMDALRGNIGYLLEPNQDEAVSSGANYSITATSFAKLDAGLDLTVETYGGPLLIIATMTVNQASGGQLQADFAVDGTRIGNATHGLQSQGVVSNAEPMTVVGITKPAAGSHTISLMVRVSSGTGTIYNTSGSLSPVTFQAIEI